MTSKTSPKLSFNLVFTLENTVLVLVCALPFLVPFGLTRNIDLQGVVVVLTGILGWTAVLLRYKRQTWQLPRYALVLLCLYLLSCLLTLIARHNFYSLFGSPLMRIGSPALLACIGSGLALCGTEIKRFLSWLYGTCSLLALVSVPYVFMFPKQDGRLGGIFHQADFLAVFMAMGLILGLGIWRLYPTRRKLIFVAQLLLAIILYLTQTRAVIALLIALGLLMLWQSRLIWQRKLLMSIAIGLVVLIGALTIHVTHAQRLTNSGFAYESLRYRLDLQHYGLKATLHEPILGYGPGSLNVALSCPSLHSPALQLTCHQGYYFDSSHNVYLDRVLALGWVGGLSFILFVLFALGKGLRNSDIERYLAYAALLVAAYYLTNPTDLEIEVFFWIFLLRPFANVSHVSA